MVPIGETVKGEVLSDAPQQRGNSVVENHASEEKPSNGISAPRPGKRGNLPSIITEKMERVPDSAADKLRVNQGGKTSPKTPKKGLQSPECGSMPSNSGQEGSTPSTIREKVSEDGYNWRKYGQKLVKGNEYVRSYYRCTHPNCLVKKQLERLHDGHVVDITYFGHHDHPKPQLNVPVAVGFVVSVVEERKTETSLTTSEGTSIDKPSQQPPQVAAKSIDIPPISNVSAKDSSKGTASQSNKIKDDVSSDDDPDSKRQKKDKDNLKMTAPDKSTSEPRVTVQTMSEVDIVNDGYRWRKYGQKLVKGNPNPRSYYRCSNSGCPMKKHVERASHDPKMVMTTYEGQHNHDLPPSRIVTHNVSGSNASPPAHDGDSSAKSDGNTTRLDMVADSVLEHISELKEEQKAKLTSRSTLKDTKCSNVVVEPRPCPENKSCDKQSSKLGVQKESDPVTRIPIESRTSDNLVAKSSIKSEGNNPCVVDMVVHDNIKTEQQNPDSEPVHG